MVTPEEIKNQGLLQSYLPARECSVLSLSYPGSVSLLSGYYSVKCEPLPARQEHSSSYLNSELKQTVI